MEFVSETRNARKDEHELRPSNGYQCTISTKNIIAFSGCPAISSAAGAVSTSAEVASHLDAVYVCELSTPWNAYCVTGVDSFVQHLAWDSSGAKLLVADAAGVVSLWVMQDCTLNRWACPYVSKRVCDDIVSIRWLHMGPVVTIASDIPGMPMLEKFGSERFAPSLGTFAGRSVEGWVAISGSGMVHFGWLQPGRAEMHVAKEPLPTAPCRIISADIGYEQDGSVAVVYTAGGRLDGAVVHSARLQLIAQSSNRPVVVDGGVTGSVPLPPPAICCQATMGFTCREAAAVRDGNHLAAELLVVQRVLYPCAYATRYAIVCLNACDASSGSELQLWSLDSHDAEAAGGKYKMAPASFVQHWRPRIASSLGACLTSCVASKMACVDILASSTAASAYLTLTLAFANGSMGVFSLKNFSLVASAAPPTLDGSLAWREQQRQLLQQQQPEACRFVAVDSSFSGSVVVSLSAGGTLHVARVYCGGPGTGGVAAVGDLGCVLDQSSVLERALLLIEYAVYTGLDCQDVLLTLRPGLAEMAVQILMDRAQCHERMLQDLIKPKLSAAKVALYVASGALSCRAIDCLTQQLLHHVSISFKAALRSRSEEMMDKSLSEKLTQACSSADTIDNIILNLEPRSDFMLDDATSLQLKPMMQWLVNLGLYLVKCIAMSKTAAAVASLSLGGGGTTGAHEYVGAMLARDVTVLQTVRELLVLVRISSMVAQRCRPQVTCAPSIDPIATLFQLLTKAWLESSLPTGSAAGAAASLGMVGSARGYDAAVVRGSPSTNLLSSAFSDALVDDCAHFESQVVLPGAERCLSWTSPMPSLLTDVNAGGSYRVATFSTGAAPSDNRENLVPMLPFWQHQLAGQRFDALQRTAVNSKEKCKQCCRCSLLTQAIKADGKVRLSESARPCLCGGLWVAV